MSVWHDNSGIKCKKELWKTTLLIIKIVTVIIKLKYVNRITRRNADNGLYVWNILSLL